MKKNESVSYAGYLELERVLDAQHPVSDTHDELLFIVQHQVSELWMKLAIHELDSARDAINADALPRALKNLSRVRRIFEQLNGAWDVLRTMTPSDYTAFRDALGTSSGFQSWQYRLIEYTLGNRNSSMLSMHQGDEIANAKLREELKRPSLYDAAVRLLSRNGMHIDTDFLVRDVSDTHIFDVSVMNAWERIYRDPDAYWTLYDLAEKLIDIEDMFRQWRFNHVTAVERVIGFKPGTGGTGGVSYLKKMLEVVLFKELWQVRTSL